MAPRTSSIIFNPPIANVINQIINRRYAAICGLNNSGKSYLLKSLKRHIGQTAYFVGPARFYHLNQIGSSMKNEQEYAQHEINFNSNINNRDHNFDQNMIGLDRVIANLSDKRREVLFTICSNLLGNKFSMKHFDDENMLSPFYIDMDGENISIGSSGTRILMTLIGLCMDENFNSIFIDEPELGLGPRVQLKVSNFLSDSVGRAEYFPHLSSVIVATHSNLFLDRRDINNNFSVSKSGDVISVNQVREFSELHNLQFNLLGNSLESLFLPSAFVFVEGKTDLPYIEKILNFNAKDKNIAIIQCNGNVKGKVNSLKESLYDISKSPFRSRIFVVLDSVVPNPNLKSELISMGLVRENIIVWQGNGIEYLYPTQLMAQIFGCSEANTTNISMNGDIISLNGKNLKKSELSSEICARLDSNTTLPDEINNKLLARMEEMIG